MKTYTKPIDTAPKDGTIIAVQDQREKLCKETGKARKSQKKYYWPTSLAYYARGKWVFFNVAVGYHKDMKWRAV